MDINFFAENYDALQARYAQLKERHMHLDISRGKPSREQLDIGMPLLRSLSDGEVSLVADGVDYRNYGMPAGIPELGKIFAEILEVPLSQMWMGNNSSLSMMFDVITRGYTHGFSGCTPWGLQKGIKFLCPVPGYDRHFAITGYFGFELVPVPMLSTGPDMDMVEELVKDPTVKGIWCVPKYSNPTGITYSDETVRRFAALRPAAKDFRIMWDDAYCVHDVTDTPDHLLGIYKECEKNNTESLLFMFTSTSKITFPGAGVAVMVAGDGNIACMREHYSFKTIGPDKINQLRHLQYLKNVDGVYKVMAEHKKLLAPKFALCQKKLREIVGETGAAKWTNPNGGYFISVDVLPGCAKEVERLCAQAGLKLTPAGASFPHGFDPQDSNIRLAPTNCPLEELDAAMDLFCVSILLAAAKKVLGK